MNKNDLSKNEFTLFNTRTPEEYIDKSLKLKIPSGRKAYITKLWMDKKGYTVEDIQHARNRHPYWKAKKMEGSAERNEERRKANDYSKNGAVNWNDKQIKKFISMNKKDKKGRYIHKDISLAKHFRVSIPSIQHYRRKYNMAIRILEYEKKRPTNNGIFNYVVKSEEILRNILREY
jgi:hypothetical protein